MKKILQKIITFATIFLLFSVFTVTTCQGEKKNKQATMKSRQQQQQQQQQQQRRRPLPATGVVLFAVAAISTSFKPICLVGVEAFLLPFRSGAILETSTRKSNPNKGLFSQPPLLSDADLLQDLPFVPKEVMAKFMAAVGEPLTAGSLQAGYQAGAVSKDELEEIRNKLPGMEASTIEIPKAQSIQTIEGHWNAALEGQPWHVKSMGKLAKATIVPLVAKLQEKSVRQANAMRWINENALLMIESNGVVVGLLSPFEQQEQNSYNKLAFNNTRAKFEVDRGVWSASMDVFVQGVDNNSVIRDDVSKSGAALQALKESMDDDGISSFNVGVPEDSSFVDPTTTIQSTDDNNVSNVGLVNAYFVPDDEIKILVVEIDGILHNVTWKGLD